MGNRQTFFDFAAEVGLTKHFGGLEDTEKLVEVCHIRDLRRDGRYALHCSVDRKEGEPLIEFLVSGVTNMINDSSIRTAVANIAASPVLTDDDVLFEFQVYKVMLIEYDHDGRRTVKK